MGIALIDAQETEAGIAITFMTDSGLEQLEGTHAEMARLASVMEQVSVLAPLNDHERVWIEDVAVGDALVRLGLVPGGRARLRIIRDR